MSLLTTRIALRHLIAEGNPSTFQVSEEEAEEPKGKKKGPPKYWDEFIKARYQAGKKKVTNTNPKTKDRYRQVTMQTLFNSDEAFKKKVMEEYAEWVKKRDDTDTGKGEATKEEDTSNSKKKKKAPPKTKGFNFRDVPQVEHFQFDIPSLPKAKPIDICYLVGAPFVGATKAEEDTTETYTFMDHHGDEDTQEVNATQIEVKSPHAFHCIRAIIEDPETGKPYLYMDTLNLKKDAPEGTGTRAFASSVFAAQKLGIKKVKCLAFRDRYRPEWVGYKVWPKMGYDGKIPDTVKLTPTIEHQLEEAGFKKPYMVSHLYMIEGGQAWWEENGESFEATFDTTPGSQSMQVLEAYLQKRMAAGGHETIEDWMYAGLETSPKKASQIQRRTNMTPLEKSLVRLAHQNPTLRPHILEMLREAKDDFFTKAKKEGWSKLKDTAIEQARKAFGIQGSDPQLVSKKINDTVVVLQDTGTYIAYAKVDKKKVSKKFYAFPDDKALKESLIKS